MDWLKNKEADLGRFHESSKLGLIKCKAIPIGKQLIWDLLWFFPCLKMVINRFHLHFDLQLNLQATVWGTKKTWFLGSIIIWYHIIIIPYILISYADHNYLSYGSDIRLPSQMPGVWIFQMVLVWLQKLHFPQGSSFAFLLPHLLCHPLP